MDERDTLFILTIVYAGLFVLLQLLGARLRPSRPVLVIVAVAALVRLPALFLLPDSQALALNDVMNFERAGRSVLALDDVYAQQLDIPRYFHPYFPFHIYAFAIAAKLSDWTPITFFQPARLFNFGAELGTAVVLFNVLRWLKPGEPAAAFRDGLSYAVCPLLFLVSGLHGQFDTVSVFFAVSAIYVALAQDRRLSNAGLAGMLIGLGVPEKLWPALLAPVSIWHYRREAAHLVTFMCSAILSVVLALGAYVVIVGGSFEAISRVIRAYRGPQNDDGHTAVLAWLAEGHRWAGDLLRWDHDVSPLPMVLAIAIVMAIAIPHMSFVRAGQRWWVLAAVGAMTMVYSTTVFVGCGLWCTTTPDFDQWMFDNVRWWTTGAWVAIAAWLAWNIAAAITHPAPARERNSTRPHAEAAA